MHLFCSKALSIINLTLLCDRYLTVKSQNHAYFTLANSFVMSMCNNNIPSYFLSLSMSWMSKKCASFMV